MNTNTYPSGRWTSTSRKPSQPERIPNAFTDFDIRNARLSELFWTAPEPERLGEAVERLDSFMQMAESLSVSERTSHFATVP